MKVQLDWQVVGDDGKWEVICGVEKGSRRKVAWWVYGLFALLIIAVAAGGYTALRLRYDRIHREAVFQIQTVIDLESRAFERGNLDLLLDQQDEGSPGWYEHQAVYAKDNPSWFNSRMRGCYAPTLEEMRTRPCSALLDGEVEDVELKGKMAWVQVLTSQGQIRQARFYRRDGTGWKHTAPQAEFWGEPIEARADTLTWRYYERDLPYIQPLIDHMLDVYGELCTTLDCPPDRMLQVEFGTRIPVAAGALVDLSGAKLTLPSPWLSGVPVEGGWDEAYLDELTYWVTYAVTARFMQSATSVDAGALSEPDGRG